MEVGACDGSCPQKGRKGTHFIPWMSEPNVYTSQLITRVTVMHSFKSEKKTGAEEKGKHFVTRKQHLSSLFNRSISFLELSFVLPSDTVCLSTFLRVLDSLFSLFQGRECLLF